MGGLRSLGRNLEKIGKDIFRKGLPLVGNAILQGHGGTVGAVFDILGVKDTDSDDEIIKKLTPESLAQIENRKLETEFNLAELEFKRDQLIADQFAEGQSTIREMVKSDDWYTRNAIPTILWVFALACLYTIIGAPVTSSILIFLGVVFGIPELMTVQLPVVEIPNWYGDLVINLFGIVMLKKGYDNTSLKAGNFEKKSKND